MHVLTLLIYDIVEFLRGYDLPCTTPHTAASPFKCGFFGGTGENFRGGGVRVFSIHNAPDFLALSLLTAINFRQVAGREGVQFCSSSVLRRGLSDPFDVNNTHFVLLLASPPPRSVIMRTLKQNFIIPIHKGHWR